MLINPVKFDANSIFSPHTMNVFPANSVSNQVLFKSASPSVYCPHPHSTSALYRNSAVYSAQLALTVTCAASALYITSTGRQQTTVTVSTSDEQIIGCERIYL